MEEHFPASMLVVAGLLRVAGASRSEPWSRHTTDQSSLEEGLVTAMGHLVPIREVDATQVTLQFDSFTSNFPNDGVSHPHEIIRMEAKENLKDGGQPLTFPDRQPRRSELSLEGAVLDPQSNVPSTNRPLNSTNMLSGLSKAAAESASQPGPPTTFLLREDGAENATGHDLSNSGKQSSLVPTKVAERDLPTTLQPEPLENPGQKMAMDSSSSLAASPGNPQTFTLGKNTAKSEFILDETTSTPIKEGLGKTLAFLPTESQWPLVHGGQTQPGLRTAEIPGAPGTLVEAQLNFSAPSQQRPLPEAHMATQRPNFASSPHGKMMRHKAGGLQTAETPALLTPSQSHTNSSLQTPETLSSAAPPQSATLGDVSQRDRPSSVFRSQFAPSSKPGVSDEAGQYLQESTPVPLHQETHHQRTIQPSRFKVAQITAALRDPLSVPKVQETTLDLSVPTQEQPQQTTMLATISGKAQGTVLSTSALGKATSSHAHPTMLRMATSTHTQPLFPVLPDAAGRITQGLSKIPLPSTFPPLLHGQRASLSTSAPPVTESALFASSPASVPTKRRTPGVSATDMLGTLASLHTAPQHESAELSTGAAASVLAKLPTLGRLASAYAGPNSSAATDSADSTPRLAGLPTLVHGNLQGTAFGTPFQVDHQMLGKFISTLNRPTVLETTVETDTAATGSNVLATAVCDHTKPKLSPDISRLFYAMTQSLPVGVYTKLQPATPSVQAPDPQLPVLGVTLPTHFKSQTSDASSFFMKGPQLFVKSVHPRAKLNTKDVQSKGSLPVATDSAHSTPRLAGLTTLVHGNMQGTAFGMSFQVEHQMLGNSISTLNRPTVLETTVPSPVETDTAATGSNVLATALHNCTKPNLSLDISRPFYAVTQSLPVGIYTKLQPATPSMQAPDSQVPGVILPTPFKSQTSDASAFLMKEPQLFVTSVHAHAKLKTKETPSEGSLPVSTASAHSTPRLVELSTPAHGKLEGRAFGMPFQVEHQMLGNSVSTQNRPTVLETTVPSPIETGTMATGSNVLAAAAHDRTKPNLSLDISRPFYAVTQSLPVGVYTKLQPDTPSVQAPDPQVPVLGVTLPTHFKSQTSGASAFLMKGPKLFVTSMHPRAKLNTKEVPSEGSLPAVATDSANSTPRLAGLPTLVHGNLQGTAFGMPFQVDHQTLVNSVSTHHRPTVPETTVLPPVETGTAVTGSNVLATAAHDHTKSNLSPDISKPFYSMTQSLPIGVLTKFQPAAPSVQAPGPEVPILGMTLPTHFKSQKPGASSFFMTEPQLFVTSMHARVKLNTKEAPSEGSLPVSTEASASTPTHAKAPQVLSVHAQTQRYLSQASIPFGTNPLTLGGTQTPKTPASSQVQLFGHLRPQPSSPPALVQTDLQPPAVSTSAEATAPNPKVLTAVHSTRQLPTTLVLPRMHHITAEEEGGKNSLPSSLQPSQPGIYSTPLPGVSATRPSQKAEGRDQSSATPSLGGPVSQTVHHKNVHLPVLSSVRLAEPFPGLRATPVPAGAEIPDLMPSSQGFILHLLNQSDVHVDGNLGSAVASSYLGIPSSLQYLSFLIRSAENMVCLQPMQNTTLPYGEPNVSGPGVTSFHEMLISSTFLGLSHPDASSLIQMSPSSVILVKPMFVFLPADEPEDPVLHSAEEEKEHTDRNSFTKAAVLRLVASSYEQRAEINSTIRQSTRASVLPTNRQVISGSVLSSLPENTTGSSQVRSITLKADPSPDQLREVASTITKSLESRDQEEGFLSLILDSPKSKKNNTISLSVEHPVSATPPMMAFVHQRPKPLPSTSELLNSPPRITSLLPVMEKTATPMLARTSGSEAKPQLNTTLILHAEDHNPGLMTPITSSTKNFEEPLSTSSSGNMDLPLEVVKHLTPLRDVMRSFLITKVFRKHPSEIQYIPSTVSDFLTFSTVKNLTEPAAVNNTYSEVVPALPRPTETSSYFMNSTLAKVSKSYTFSPIPLRARERPRTPPSPTSFFAFAQAHTMHHLEDTNIQVRPRPPASMSSQVSTNSYFTTSAMKGNQANPMLTGRSSLTSAEGQSVNEEETGKDVRHTKTHNPGEAIHFTPTRLSTDPALLVSTEFSSTSLSGTVGSTGFQRERHKSPLTTFHLLSPSSTHKDTTVSPIGGRAPPLEKPPSDLHSLRLSETAAASEAEFFSPLTAEEEVTQHGGEKKAEVAPPFPTSSSSHPQPASLGGGHQDEARLLKYKQKQDSLSFMPSPGSTSSTLESSTVAKAPTFLVTTLFSGSPSDGPLDKVLNQTPRLRSLPLDIFEKTLNLHTQVLLTLESLSGASEMTAEGDFMVEASSAGEFDGSYLHTVGEQATVVTRATAVMGTAEEAAKDPLAVLQQSASNSSLLDSKMSHRRPARSDDAFLDGFAIVSDDTCGSGNYTTEMSLHRSTGQLTSRPESFLAVIVLRSNNSRPTLRVKSCCATPTTRPAGLGAACCLFPRTPLACKHIQLHRNSRHQTASFTIQPFQMLNRSVAYLHCELSICLSSHAGCEQSCSEDRESRSQPSGRSSYQTLRNLISFGPLLQALPEFPSEPAAESELAMRFPVLVGSFAGIALLLGISVFIWFFQRRKIRTAAKLEGEGLCAL